MTESLPRNSAPAGIEAEPSLYQQLIEQSPDAIAIHVGGIVVFANPAGLRLFRAERLDQVLGRSVLEFVHPDDRPLVIDRMRRMKEYGNSVPRVEERFIALDGTMLVGETVATPFIYEGRDAVLVMIRDATERRRMEQEIARSRDQLQAILRSVGDGVTVQAPDGSLIYANELAAQLTGFDSPEALLAAPVGSITQRFELFDEAGQPAPISYLPARRVFLGEQPQEVVLGFRALPHGEVRWASIKATPICDELGHVQLVVNVFKDVTGQRNAEQERLLRLEREQQAREAAEAARQRFAVLAEASKLLAGSLDYETTLSNVAHLAVASLADWCVVDTVDPDGTVKRVASAHLDPAKEAWAREVEERYPPDERSAAALMIRTGQSVFLPDVPDEMLPAAARDEQHLAVLRQLGMRSLMIVPMQARGTVVGAITFIAAESGRRYSQEDLAFAEELAQRAALAVDNARLYRESVRVAAERQAMLGQMAEGVVIADASGRLTFVNAAAIEMLGIPEPKAAIDTFAAAYQITDVDGAPYSPEQIPLVRAIHGEAVIDEVWKTLRWDGREIVMQGSAAPVHTDDGTLIGAVATFRDITTQHVIQQERDAFLSLVAHELCTPITVIRGHIQLLARRQHNAQALLSQRLPTIERQTNHLTTLVNDLLDLSRIQTGRLECKCLPIDYLELVRAVVDEMRVLHPERLVRIHTPETIWVDGDDIRLRQVLVNLLDNAFKYGPAGTEVSITVEEKDDAVVTYVCDQGPQLPEAERRRIFERFYRVPAQRDAHSGGLGIGLYIARGIVEAHGGHIWVEDDDHSSFAFSLKSVPPFRG